MITVTRKQRNKNLQIKYENIEIIIFDYVMNLNYTET